jgi:molybdopterin-containing oxidoreductase family iron-sulfur binding subunit
VAASLLVNHEGRPTKIGGNPLHPASLGAADIFAQASVLGLSDPDRVQTLTNVGEIRPWPAFLGAIRAALTAQQPAQGAGLRILTESVNSPTLASQLRDLLARYPEAKWHQWDPASRENARAGAKLACSASMSRQSGSTRPTSSWRSTPTSSAAARAVFATRAISPHGASPSAPTA